MQLKGVGDGVDGSDDLSKERSQSGISTERNESKATGSEPYLSRTSKVRKNE
jgi:hypothetical protein